MLRSTFQTFDLAESLCRLSNRFHRCIKTLYCRLDDLLVACRNIHKISLNILTVVNNISTAIEDLCKETDTREDEVQLITYDATKQKRGFRLFLIGGESGVTYDPTSDVTSLVFDIYTFTDADSKISKGDIISINVIYYRVSDVGESVLKVEGHVNFEVEPSYMISFAHSPHLLIRPGVSIVRIDGELSRLPDVFDKPCIFLCPSEKTKRVRLTISNCCTATEESEHQRLTIQTLGADVVNYRDANFLLECASHESSDARWSVTLVTDRLGTYYIV